MAEIWRYKKDETLPWEKVYKAPADSGITRFRFMIKDRPSGGNPCIYAAAFEKKVQVLKTTNGVNWFILPDEVMRGTSSRSMLIQNGKVYISTIDETNPSEVPMLYSSEDPEFFPWVSVIDYNAPGFDPTRNPRGSISNMEVFYNRIYALQAMQTEFKCGEPMKRNQD